MHEKIEIIALNNADLPEEDRGNKKLLDFITCESFVTFNNLVFWDSIKELFEIRNYETLVGLKITNDGIKACIKRKM